MELGDNILSPIEYRPTAIRIDLDALRHNLTVITAEVRRHVPHAKVMPIVKANAYGHGLISTSKYLESIGASSLGVAFVEEGILLRRAGIKIPILVLGGLVGDQLPLFVEHDLDVTASSLFKLGQVDQVAATYGRRARVHLKIDTGMERIGVHWYNAEGFIRGALECKHIEIVGIYSHFADSESNRDLSRRQLESFLATCDLFSRFGAPIPLRHIGNSGSLHWFGESTLDLVRPGLALYGITHGVDSELARNLRPVMSLCSQVVYFKVVKSGNGVSYGHTWKAPCDSRMVTVPIGYGDGYPRRLSNRGTVLIRGKRYPIVGTICMDMLMVNIGSDEAYNGDEVVLWGRQGEEEITVREIAALVETTPHEIVTAMNLRVPRKYLPSAGPSAA